jgi:plasmid stabilization system protein ParE
MKVRYRLSALTDLHNIHQYIAEADPMAARAVVQRIRKSITRLELFPKSGRRGVLGGTRELVVPGLPYIVVYIAEADYVDVRAIYHGARKKPPQ